MDQYCVSCSKDIICGVSHLGTIRPPHYGGSSTLKSDLLASLIKAMAIRILFLRKMRMRMMITSTMARMITGGRERERDGERETESERHACVCVYVCLSVCTH